MNNNETSSVPFGTVYAIINNRGPRTPEGHMVGLPYTDRPGYISLSDFEALESEGAITIVRKGGGTNLAESYGRTQVIYYVNN